MSTVLWATLLAAAALWPSRLAGPLDGAPLDAPLEALMIGLALPALILFDRRILRQRGIRLLIVLLLAWKGVTTATLVQDGWCLRLTSPTPLFLDQEQVPNAWDMRADWRAVTPACSAVMTRSYPEIAAFPAWFYNLPPNNLLQPALPSERPPAVIATLDLHGHLFSGAPGVFRVGAGDDVTLSATIDEIQFTQDELEKGVTLGEGAHAVALSGGLKGDRWALMPEWNGRPLWTSAVATIAPAGGVDRLARPWANWIAVVLVAGIVLWSAILLLWPLGVATFVASLVPASLALVAALVGSGALTRVTAIALAAPAFLRVPRRARNLRGASALIGVPILVLFSARGFAEVGRVTWYTSGDDWWMFQHFAYRIFMEGYWLEGGEPTFWFQPLYRWIAGSLHLVFGDSSVGELFWDGGCAIAGGLFAFHATGAMAGFRWAMAALTLTLLVAGSAWYLFGRGLSELTSTGLLYLAALLALRGRRGEWRFALAAGLCAALAFYARLNSLPWPRPSRRSRCRFAIPPAAGGIWRLFGADYRSRWLSASP